MKECEQSLIQKKLNSDYLELLFSPEVKKAKRSNNSIFKRFRLLFSFIKAGRYKEIAVRILGKKSEARRDIGVLYTDDDNREYNGGQKVVVYTAIFGNNTPINNPWFCNPNYDYYIFTDQELPKESRWKKVFFDEKDLPEKLDNAGKNRWFKMHPHLYFPNYDFSVYVDGGIIIVADFMPWIEAMEGKIIGTHILSLPIDCVYESSKTVVGSGKAPKDLVVSQMKKYREEGFPEHFGMYENGVLVRPHMQEECIRLMNAWWEQMTTYTMRDQLSFGYVLWKQQIQKDKILLLGNNIFKNPRIRFWDL